MISPSRSHVLVLIAACCLAGCASDGSSVPVSSQAAGSSYFSLTPPAVSKVEGGFELSGRLCRRARTTPLSPPGVRLEHIAANGEPIEVARAPIATIYRNADQACSDYATRVAWRIGEGDSVRACIDHGHPCRIDQ